MSRGVGWLKGLSDETIVAASSLEHIGPASWVMLRSQFPSLAEVLGQSRAKLTAAGLKEDQARSLTNLPKIGQLLELIERHKLQLITLDDKRYPALLKEIPDPPLWLYLRGNGRLLNHPSLTVVGSRKPTTYAISATKYLLTADFLKSVVIISGLAYGIDKLAHQLALAALGSTIAVLAGGLDEIYPSANTQLARQIIAEDGLIISEYPPLSRPRPYKFPIRNRILAGLSPATLIIEASVRSGTMVTARLANEFNREVAAVPNQILLESVQGANQLISQGAMPIYRPENLRELYGLANRPSVVDNQSAEILNCLVGGKQTAEQISGSLKFDFSHILAKLTEMELAGLIDQPQPGQYQKKH